MHGIKSISVNYFRVDRRFLDLCKFWMYILPVLRFPAFTKIRDDQICMCMPNTNKT